MIKRNNNRSDSAIEIHKKLESNPCEITSIDKENQAVDDFAQKFIADHKKAFDILKNI